MADFVETMAKPSNMSEAAQMQAGTPMTGGMGDEHKRFAATIASLLENGSISITNPETFLNKAVYDAQDQEWKTKTDLTMLNVATLLGHIYEFYRSKQTPDACPQLATMIEELWQMKMRIEVHADVFKF